MVSSNSHISNIRNDFFRSLPVIFPDIDRVIVLSKLPSEKISGLEMRRENNGYREKELFAESLNDIFVHEKERTVYTWIHKENIPFEEKPITGGQLTLFSEREYVILNVKTTIKVIDGEVIDVYYIFFREDQSNFGISRINGIFDPSLKAVVGSMLSKYIAHFYNYANVERAKINEFINETKVLMNQNEQQSDRLPEMMRQWADDFLMNYQKPVGKSLHLSEQALKIIAQQNFQTARKMLDKAASYSLMLHSDSNEIEILHSYLIDVVENEVVQPKTIIETTVRSKKSKVLKLLDNMESAAVKLIERGEDLTGTTVGQAMDRPVSAPAITDYLRKNSRYVGMLLDEHSDRWEIIRTQFRPLINVKEKIRSKKIVG